MFRLMLPSLTVVDKPIP